MNRRLFGRERMKNAEKQKFHKKYVAFSAPFGYNIGTEKCSGIQHLYIFGRINYEPW